ncbi:FAD-dependent oxidoreductase [Deinococcus multiflagellatus]|uniref:FAD-dependent oxidoreductase n=1 Tax=Deinococcus multiflagellatus TaxID=1656887 RepID=A0ABW1ZR65_9DEIO
MTTRLDVLVIGAGQAGLATAYHLQGHGLRFQVLEAGQRPVGAWPQHYASLKLFSPARHASLPGWPFSGDPERYPTRNEVVAYLEAYAAHFQFPIVTGAEVAQVLPDGEEFRVLSADGRIFCARAVVAATGTFRRPFMPEVPGRETFGGKCCTRWRTRNRRPSWGSGCWWWARETRRCRSRWN